MLAERSRMPFRQAQPTPCVSRREKARSPAKVPYSLWEGKAHDSAQGTGFKNDANPMIGLGMGGCISGRLHGDRHDQSGIPRGLPFFQNIQNPGFLNPGFAHYCQGQGQNQAHWP